MIHLQQRKEYAKKGKSMAAYYQPDSKAADQYQKIYTNLKCFYPDRANRVLLITSPGYKEGKSTTVLNLGISSAQSGDKVLIIDAHLRKPVLHELLKLDNTTGLSSVLLKTTTFEDAVHSSGIEKLDILTSGPLLAHSAKLLGSQTMKNVMGIALTIYDIILIDSPPLLETADASLLASVADGVILVAKYAKTKIEKIIETKRLLDLSHTKVIGSLLNN